MKGQFGSRDPWLRQIMTWTGDDSFRSKSSLPKRTGGPHRRGYGLPMNVVVRACHEAVAVCNDTSANAGSWLFVACLGIGIGLIVAALVLTLLWRHVAAPRNLKRA